jgi:plastocyanin
VQWKRARVGLVIVAAALLVISAACSSSDDGNKSTSSTSSGGGAAETAVTITATDNKYDKTAITVPANQEVKVTLDNKGQAIHDWKVVNEKSKDGKEIGTQLITGGSSETVEFTIDKPGTYDYHCSVHPAEMMGKLTVK